MRIFNKRAFVHSKSLNNDCGILLTKNNELGQSAWDYRNNRVSGITFFRAAQPFPRY
jgi:hypothetical protein